MIMTVRFPNCLFLLIRMLWCMAVRKKIAVLKETLESEALDPDIKTAILKAIDLFRAQGHTVEYVSFDLLDYLVPALLCADDCRGIV